MYKHKPYNYSRVIFHAISQTMLNSTQKINRVMKINTILLSFEVFVEVHLRISLFWDVTWRHMPKWWLDSHSGRFTPGETGLLEPTT